jgi:hypothetical protein
MSTSINPAAGTADIRATALQMQTKPPTGTAPSSAPATAHSRSQTTVDQLFQITAGLASKLVGRMENVEANRVQGNEGLDPGAVVESLSDIKAQLDDLRARAPRLTQFIDALSAEVDHAVEMGPGGSERIIEMAQQAQKALAERYGYVGHIVNVSA